MILVPLCDVCTSAFQDTSLFMYYTVHTLLYTSIQACFQFFYNPYVPFNSNVFHTHVCLYLMHAKVLFPPIFIEHDPQIPVGECNRLAMSLACYTPFSQSSYNTCLNMSAYTHVCMHIHTCTFVPSRQDLRNVKVGSISFLILMRASSTIGPQVLRSTLYSCIYGFSPGFSGFC